MEDFSKTRNVMVHDDVEIPVAAGELIRHVYDATAHLNWSPGAARGDRATGRVLSSVLTFCYATGIYSSQEIEEAARHDPIVRYLCANHRPRWEEIRDFRRRNSTALKMALGRVIQVVQVGVPDRSGRYVDDSRRRFGSDQDCLAAADQQLRRAIQADSVALDF